MPNAKISRGTDWGNITMYSITLEPGRRER
jgi:hypothetical protein